MIVVEGFAIDGILRVVHPNLTDGGQLKQSVVHHSLIVALKAQMLEIHLPGSVFYLTFFIRSKADAILPVVIVGFQKKSVKAIWLSLVFKNIKKCRLYVE